MIEGVALSILFTKCKETPSLHFLKKMDKAFSIARNAMGGHRNPFPPTEPKRLLCTKNHVLKPLE